MFSRLLPCVHAKIVSAGQTAAQSPSAAYIQSHRPLYRHHAVANHVSCLRPFSPPSQSATIVSGSSSLSVSTMDRRVTPQDDGCHSRSGADTTAGHGPKQRQDLRRTAGTAEPAPEPAPAPAAARAVVVAKKKGRQEAEEEERADRG